MSNQKSKILFLFYREPRKDGIYTTFKNYVFVEAVKKSYEVRSMFIEKIENNRISRLYDKPTKFWKLLNLIFRFRSTRLTNYFSQKFRDEYYLVLDQFNPDIIFVDHLSMMQYPLLRKGNAKIIFYDDESISYNNAFSKSSIRDKIRNFGLKQYERKAIRFANITLTITREECEYLTKVTQSNIEVLSYPVEINSANHFQIENINKTKILYIGNFSHSPNRFAVQFISEKIYPYFKDDGNVEFQIIGRHTDLIAQKINNNIRIFEDVPDVNPYIRNAQIFIAPIYYGSGIRVKIIEAATIGIPLIISPLANLGINFVHEKEAIICTSAVEFVRAIKKVSSDLDINSKNEMIKNARRKIEQNFSAKVISRQLIDIVKRM